MSISEISNKIVPAGAKGYGLTIAEPTTQWYSAAITAGVSKAYGSWTQLIASTSEDVLLWLVVIDPPTWGGTERSVTSIGTGAAAAEVEVLVLPTRYVAAGHPIYFSLPVPILIPSGTRIAARMTIDGTSAGTGYVTLGHIKASVVSSF